MASDVPLRVMGWGPFSIPGEKKRWREAHESAQRLLETAAAESGSERSAPDLPTVPTEGSVDTGLATDEVTSDAAGVAHSTLATNIMVTEKALGDLGQIQDQAVRRDLLNVARTELTASPDEDDADAGAVSGGLFWRRGITKRARSSLSPYEDGAPDHSWDYVIIYRALTLGDLQPANVRGFMVLRILHNSDLAAAIIAADEVISETQPEFNKLTADLDNRLLAALEQWTVSINGS
jgi:hypothetical protein